MAQETKTVKVSWASVYSMLERISSYEGRSAVTPSGDSDFLNVHITDQDKSFVEDYISHGTSAVEESLGNLISDVEFGTNATTSDKETTYKFVIDTNRVGTATLSSMIVEAIASYAMRQWVSERKPSRMEFYSNLYTQMVSSITRSLTRKSKPSLDIYNVER